MMYNFHGIIVNKAILIKAWEFRYVVPKESLPCWGIYLVCVNQQFDYALPVSCH